MVEIENNPGIDFLSAKEKEEFQRPLRIGIMGTMASGKDTLAKLLGEKWQVNPIEEKWQDNPYLADFYVDPEAPGISFKTQMRFLMLTSNQMRESEIRVNKANLMPNRKAVPQVEIFATTNEMNAIYAQVQAKMEFITANEYSLYEAAHQALKEKIDFSVDLFVITHASEEELKARILYKRGRSIEQLKFFEEYPSYLGKLNEGVEVWNENTSHKYPVILVDTNTYDLDLNVKDKKEILAHIEGEIRNYLIDKSQPIPDFLKTR
jgi:deoxyadenosine/deoxycytidine kinase